MRSSRFAGKRTSGTPGVSNAPTLTPLLFTAILSSLMIATPRVSPASERGSALILCADCADATCIVGSYGAGFIVGTDEARDAAYVLTARHVVVGFNRVYVLYDPTAFPVEYAHELESGSIPPVLANALAHMGHPRPTGIRSGLLAESGGRAGDQSLVLQTESWILSGAGREYLALPNDGRLDLFHLLPAVVARESSAALDVALLTVDDFPHCERDPVLYMDTPDSISVGTSVTTFGCQCGLAEGISRAEARGAAVLSDPGFLSYESDLVSAGFSGGPVLVGDHVVAMNLTQDLRTGSRIRARLASGFKDLVDSWMGLRRMKIDLLIDSPEGARDGVVSTSQDFTVRTSARLDPGGQVLAPVVAVHLGLPSPYQTHGEVVDVLTIGEERCWTISSPEEVTGPMPMRLYGNDSPSRSDSTLLAEVTLSTEEGARLKGVLVEAPRDGAGLFLGDEFPVSVKFEQFGQSLTDMAGEVTVDVALYQFEIQGGQPSRPIALETPVEWRLKTQDESVGAPISFRANLHSLDRNGRPIRVELPETITIRVKEEWGFRYYIGIGRLSLQGSGGESGGQVELGKGSEGESKVELELGVKFRVGNVMQRGIPLYLTVASGFGIDDIWEKETETGEGTVESFIADWRAWAGLGLSAGFGPVEACVDAGYIKLDRYIDDNAPDELAEYYATEGVGSVFIRPGIELALSPMFSVYAGGRIILDQDCTEYYLQVRLRNGK